MEEDCVFCDRERIKEDILHETGDLFVKVGFAIAAPGHVMIIPNFHKTCFAEVPDEIFDKADQLKTEVARRISEEFSQPFFIEYAVFGQTVPHAHVHLIPKTSAEYTIDSVVEEVLSEIPIPIEETDRKGLRKIWDGNGRYVSIEEDGRLYVCSTRDIAEEELFPFVAYRPFLNKRGASIPNGWKNMTKLQQEKDEANRRLTKDKLKF